MLGNSDLLHIKRNGQRFEEFVDRLVQATAYHCGVPQNQVHCQLRANIKDGGIDTRIDSPIASSQGWFSTKTDWQYKSVEGTEIDDADKVSVPNDSQAEIRNNPYAKDLIAQGYGMCFCILGDLSPQKVAAWEAQLLKEVQCVDPNAIPPRVVHGECLRRWAESFPSIVQWLARTPQIGITWKAWEQERTLVSSRSAEVEAVDGYCSARCILGSDEIANA